MPPRRTLSPRAATTPRQPSDTGMRWPRSRGIPIANTPAERPTTRWREAPMPFDGLRTSEDPGIAPPPRWHEPREVRTGTGLLLLMLGIGWLGGQLLAWA